MTLCRLEPDTELCILELAMRGFGQIAELARYSRPDAGVVTAIAPVAVKDEEAWRGKVVKVTTAVDNPDLLLRSDMTGTAKIYCGQRRLFDVVSRRLARYVRVEFWSWW